MDSLEGIGARKSSHPISPYVASDQRSCMRHYPKKVKSLLAQTKELLEGQSLGGILQYAPPRQESTKEITGMRRSLTDKANGEFSSLVQEFTRIAPGIQEQKKDGFCRDTAYETYDKLKAFMEKEKANSREIKNWDVALINDNGAHFAVMLVPKSNAVRKGEKPENITLPVGSSDSGKTKELPAGVVLESSMLGRGPLTSVIPDHGSWGIWGYKDWHKHGPCPPGPMRLLTGTGDWTKRHVYIEKLASSDK